MISDLSARATGFLIGLGDGDGGEGCPDCNSVLTGRPPVANDWFKDSEQLAQWAFIVLLCMTSVAAAVYFWISVVKLQERVFKIDGRMEVLRRLFVECIMQEVLGDIKVEMCGDMSPNGHSCSRSSTHLDHTGPQALTHASYTSDGDLLEVWSHAV